MLRRIEREGRIVSDEEMIFQILLLALCLAPLFRRLQARRACRVWAALLEGDLAHSFKSPAETIDPPKICVEPLAGQFKGLMKL